MQRRTKRLLFGGAALAVLILLAVWLWPRDYSPADPRGYIPFRKIPLADELAERGVNLVGSSQDWNFDLLRKYNLHVYDTTPRDDAEREEWIRWNNAAVYDFLCRVAEDRPAKLRKMDFWSEHYIYHAGVWEIRYWPLWDCFALTEDHRRCVDSCNPRRSAKPIFSNVQTLEYFTRGESKITEFYITTRTPDSIRPFQYCYIPGLDADMDAGMEAVVTQLIEKGILKKEE